MRTRWLRWMCSAGLALAAQACVVRDTRPVNTGYGYGYGAGTASGGVTVGEPAPNTVSSLPPEPLYEQMTVSPGFGYVWIDGYWHWNSFEWVWVSGRWVREQGSGFVYVQPYYDYANGAYVYMPGYWSSRDRVPRGWYVRDHRDGRPTVVAAPPGGVRPPPGVRPLPVREPRPAAYPPPARTYPAARPYQPLPASASPPGPPPPAPPPGAR
jgi:WXXGXW repeat (2 copies)